MNRTEKSQWVSHSAEAFRRSPHVIVTSFQGLTGNQVVDLRRKVRAAGGTYRVVKNRLARRAAAGTPVAKLQGSLTGPRGLASHESDPVVLAKVLTEFAKDNPQLEVVAGVVDGVAVLDAAGVRALAALPGLPEVRARLAALIATPARLLARVLIAPAEQLARVLEARSGKLKEAGGETGETGSESSPEGAAAPSAGMEGS